MENLIKALQIFLKYGNDDHPTWCAHDTLYVTTDPDVVSEADLKELDRLGFFPNGDVGEDSDGFMSFKFGSC
jgi:hypothetical protein